LEIPLPQFIERLYLKQFRRDRPAEVMSIEEKGEMDRRKDLSKRAKKATENEHNSGELTSLNRKEEG